MSEHIKIIEVGPRDGLQNEKQPVSIDTKVGLIKRLVDAGCWRQFKFDHLCQLNFDQGSKAGFVVPGCG